jgi:RHS repeat-associated protein
MSYDRMGRRVTKNNQRFVYDSFLQIANSELKTLNSKLQTFIWDPTEPVATRPLAWLVLRSLGEGGYYTHDGNKNVSEVVAGNGDVAAHYEYAPFGAIVAQRGKSASTNPWRFSSEYTENETETVYYNYRHYEPVAGRWLSMDLLEELDSANSYSFVHNETINFYDYIGNCSSVCGYIDYSALGAGTRCGHDLRNSRKEPSLWDQFGSLDDPFHQEDYFESRYGLLIEVYKLRLVAQILRRVDCKSDFVEIGIDSFVYDPGGTWFPFIPCSGGDVYEGLKPQGWYERWCAEGGFTFKIDNPILIEYEGDCKDCKRKYRWHTKMYVLDELGVSRGDRWPVSWLRPIAPCRIVRRAERPLEGEGECTCDK